MTESVEGSQGDSLFSEGLGNCHGRKRRVYGKSKRILRKARRKDEKGRDGMGRPKIRNDVIG